MTEPGKSTYKHYPYRIVKKTSHSGVVSYNVEHHRCGQWEVRNSMRLTTLSLARDYVESITVPPTFEVVE